MVPSASAIFDRVLVTGASGQLGQSFIRHLGPRRCVAVTRQVLDLSRTETIRARLNYFKPTAVINAAAYTKVDQAEDEEELATVINGTAPGEIAQWCAQADVPFIHFSTDYVFSGVGVRPWNEDDATAPLNAYGRSKLEGERQIIAAGGRFLIFRTSWIYNETGANFFRTMLRLGAEKPELKVVSDQIGAPTYAPMLAAGVCDALEAIEGAVRFPSGIFHLTNQGETSWRDFAAAIFEAAREEGIRLSVECVNAVTTAEYGARARRPLNSRLSCDRVERVFGVRLPSWQSGLAVCMSSYAMDTS